MKNNGSLRWAGICPICGKGYNGRPALSRIDNQTFICPECGQRQALESIICLSKNKGGM